MTSPHHWEIYEADLDPVVGSEIGKRRPVLIVSNDLNNEYAGTVSVLPLTSRPAKRVYRFEVSVPAGVGGLTADSRIKANQIRTLDKRRLGALRGSLPAEYMSRVNEAIRVHLDMEP